MHDGKQLRSGVGIESVEFSITSSRTPESGVTVASMIPRGSYRESADSKSPPTWWVLAFSPVLSIVGGLVVFAAADNAARASRAAAVPLLWIGLLLIFIPISIRLLGRGASGRERLLLVLTLYLTLYLVSFMQSPLLFKSHDALGQLRSAEDIINYGHLFHPNPIVPPYAFYPGIELATSSLAQLSGLSLFASGVIIVGAARIVLAISLFVVIERLIDARAAGIACVLYATNPSFLFFDAQFAYESLALPLAILTVAVLVQRGRHALRWEGALALFLTCSVVVTHPATTVWLLVLLVAWVLFDLLFTTRRIAAPPRLIALLGSAFALEWFFVTAKRTPALELGPIVSSAFSAVVGLVTGKSAAKHLFAPASGPSDALILRMMSFLSVGILLALVVISIWHWRRVREPIKVTLIVLMLVYPLSLVLRFTAAGTETSQRASEFLFLGIGFGVAGLSTRWLWSGRSYQYFSVTLAVAIFVGGIVVGTPPYSRLPGPYLVEADPRSIDFRTIEVASWVRAHLPAGSVIAADRDNALALAAIGLVDPAQGLKDGQSVPNLYFSPTFDSRDLATIQAFGISYILVDLRLSTNVPYAGIYFDPDEPLAGHYMNPIARADLAKFATAPGLTRIYDDGEIQIYQVDTKVGP